MEGAQRKTPSRGPPGAAASGEWWGPSRPQDVPSEGNGSSRLACCGSHGAESGSPLSLRRLPAAATGLGQARGPSARALAARGESQQAWGERPHHELLPEAGRSGVGPPLPPRSAADQQRSQTAARPQEPPSHVSDDGGPRHGARGASRMQTWFRPPAGPERGAVLTHCADEEAESWVSCPAHGRGVSRDVNPGPRLTADRWPEQGLRDIPHPSGLQ